MKFRKKIKASHIESTQSIPSGAYAKSTIAFVALVLLAVSTQTAFKLSQRNGKYEYNTMSAMVVVECIKLGISLLQNYSGSGKSFDEARQVFRNIPHIAYRSYFFLAFSYAVYNQLVFFVMRVAEPGTFSLLKSFTPAIVSSLNICIFGEALTRNQWLCVLIQIFGIIPVIADKDSTNDDTASLGYEPAHMFLMFFTVTMGSINTVYNAKVIKELTLPIAVQNIILYMFGAVFNLLGYTYSRYGLRGGEDDNQQGFFNGYNNPGVILVLVLNSFVGIAITIIYKYGDAVLKTLSGPLSSSILVYISYLFFNMPLDIVKAAGAAVVVIDTLLYLSLKPAPKTSTEGNKMNAQTRRNTNFLSLLLVVIALAGIQILSIPDLTSVLVPSNPAFLESSAASSTEKVPIVLIIQALKLEEGTDQTALEIKKSKLSIFESYRPYFQDMIYDSPLYVGDRSVKDACNDAVFEDLDASCLRCQNTIYTRGPDEHRYACAGNIMKEVQRKPDLPRGVLVIHADFYLLPAFPELAKRYLRDFPDSYWLPTSHEHNRSVARQVFSNFTVPNKTDWHWPRYWKKLESFRADVASSKGLEGKIAIPTYKKLSGWSDLYFTPVEYWEDFIPLSQIAMKHKLLNEIAVPLIHQLIAEMHDSAGEAQIPAMGGCCINPLMHHLESKEDMIASPCGHKINLAVEWQRNSIIEAWQNVETPLEVPVDV